MAKIYQVFHLYEVDGGFGDAIGREDILATFEDKDDAFAFVERFGKPHVYDKPYASLNCGELIVMESDLIGKGEEDFDKIDTSHFWWLHNEVLV